MDKADDVTLTGHSTSNPKRPNTAKTTTTTHFSAGAVVFISLFNIKRELNS